MLDFVSNPFWFVFCLKLFDRVPEGNSWLQGDSGIGQWLKDCFLGVEGVSDFKLGVVFNINNAILNFLFSVETCSV